MSGNDANDKTKDRTNSQTSNEVNNQTSSLASEQLKSPNKIRGGRANASTFTLTHQTELEDYILAHTDPEPELLHYVDRMTHLRTIQPRMISGHAQGALLKMLVRMVRPRLLLEVGTFTGYSALAMAEGLSDPAARLHTVEINDELEEMIRENIGRSERRDQIVVHIGTLEQALSDMERELGKVEIDMVFIDADKRHYAEYYNTLLPYVRKGGFLLADNVLWDGHVLSPAKASDHHTQALQEFNDMVAADPRVEKVIMPVRDGIMMMMKK
ncbi:MAG: O-methyltransferase [Bacteroidales bacterium]|nr:O-methyltransferase [Bacteroidales bacterium]